MPYEMNLTYIPTIVHGNFNKSSLMSNSKYAVVDDSYDNPFYKNCETLKFNITEDYEGK